jgi:muconolactone delta-isomerase
VSIAKEDGTHLADRGKFVKVWRRLGVWRIVADCWSSNLPASSAQHEVEKRLPVVDNVTVISENVPKSA